MRCALALLAFTLGPLACAVVKPIVADSGDLADYRAFRVAAHEGVRLSRAQHYLDAHPSGAWASEVRAAFDAEEPRYFEAATASRAKTSEYLTDLPHGPHAAAAIALLTAFDTKVEDIATARLLRDARRTEAKLERASVQRRGIGETILGDVAALLDPSLYGARPDELPPTVRSALGGTAPPTWGGRPLTRRTTDFFFSVPSRLARESRIVTIELALELEAGRVTSGVVRGVDLFVHWEEADTMKARDPTSPGDRAAAAEHAADLLSGALEARLPVARCEAPASPPDELLVRKCDGWTATIKMGSAVGEVDAIVLSGPLK